MSSVQSDISRSYNRKGVVGGALGYHRLERGISVNRLGAVSRISDRTGSAGTEKRVASVQPGAFKHSGLNFRWVNDLLQRKR